ncbi:putative SP-containing protein [Vairimorpha necatrix]|uniref:SP-containing protein n=1 Tax=Vairimorpha necatrix TaxID=6039 RepID=A0AAX4J9U3_9MICR
MLFIILYQVYALLSFNIESNSHEVYATSKNIPTSTYKSQNSNYDLKDINNQPFYIHYDYVDIENLKKISKIVFRTLMYDSSVIEIMYSFFNVSKPINSNVMKKLERKFQKDVTLFLLNIRPRRKSRNLNSFIQTLAYNSYKLIYHLSRNYKINTSTDRTILMYSIRNNIKLKVKTEFQREIEKLFDDDVLFEVFENQKMFLEGFVNSSSKYNTTQNVVTAKVPLSYKKNEITDKFKRQKVLSNNFIRFG